MRILPAKTFRNLPTIRGVPQHAPEPLIVSQDELLSAALCTLATSAANALALAPVTAPISGKARIVDPPSFVPPPETIYDAYQNRTRLALLQDLDEPEPPIEKFPGTGRKLGRKAQKVKMPTVDAYGKLCRQ